MISKKSSIKFVIALALTLALFSSGVVGEQFGTSFAPAAHAGCMGDTNGGGGGGC